MNFDAFPQVDGHDPEYARDDAAPQRRKAPGEAGALRGVLFVISYGQHVCDPLVHDLLLAVDALGIDAQQNIHPVASTSCYLRSRYAAIEPERDGRVPKVVRPSRER
jgi:hypothetical protein